MIYTGLMAIYQLKNIAPKGLMPAEKLVKVCDEYYEERTIGVTRYYAALGADRRVDMVARIWLNPEVFPGQYAILEDGNQYRVDFTQKTTDDDGLPVMDLTLVRLEKNYDVLTEYAAETVSTVSGT